MYNSDNKEYVLSTVIDHLLLRNTRCIFPFLPDFLLSSNTYSCCMVFPHAVVFNGDFIDKSEDESLVSRFFWSRVAIFIWRVLYIHFLCLLQYQVLFDHDLFSIFPVNFYLMFVVSFFKHPYSLFFIACKCLSILQRNAPQAQGTKFQCLRLWYWKIYYSHNAM